MESLKRSVIMLKYADDKLSNAKNTAVLKLQEKDGSLVADLSAPSAPPGCSLYLFGKDGDGRFAADVKDGLAHAALSGLPLSAVAGAAVADMKTLAFVLKSTHPDWTSIAARFKFKHAKGKAPQPVTPPPAAAQPVPDASPAPPVFAPDEPRVCDTCPHVIRQDRINPFPFAFPNSEWVKISYPGPTGWWHYISGKIRSGDTVIVKVLGVPGEYGMAPPIWLEGFGTYMRCATPDASGYWLMFQDAETGEVLDMDLSPRGG